MAHPDGADESPAPTPAPHDDKRRFFRSAGAVSAATGLSRLTGLAREMVMARLFGASAAYDAFLLGFRIPNLARDLFAEGALSSAFVPTFAQVLERKGKREAAEQVVPVGVRGKQAAGRREARLLEQRGQHLELLR